MRRRREEPQDCLGPGQAGTLIIIFLLRRLATPTVSISCRYRKLGGSSGSRIEYALLAARAAQPSSPQTRLVCWSVLLDPQLTLSSQLLLPPALRYHFDVVSSRGPPEASSSNRVASPSATSPLPQTARRPTLALVSLESSASAHPPADLSLATLSMAFHPFEVDGESPTERIAAGRK